MPRHPQDIAGNIRVTLTPGRAHIGAVEIVSTRPLEPARIFEGRTVDAMTAAIGRVFSLCGTAQTVAALDAAEAALGCPPDRAVAAARSAARQAEMLTQIVTRLALHWRRVLGLPLAPDAVRAALAAEQAIAAELLGEAWRRPGAGVAGAVRAGMVAQIDVTALVAPLAEALRARGLEAYGALPDGAAPEAGVLAQHWRSAPVAAARAVHGVGLAARLAAAEAALRALPAGIADALAICRPATARAMARPRGEGAATVETARGPLTHEVEIRDLRVTRCRTTAPTERNFAPGGPVAAGLQGAPLDLLAAELHILAIDPCVAASVDLAPT